MTDTMMLSLPLLVGLIAIALLFDFLNGLLVLVSGAK